MPKLVSFKIRRIINDGEMYVLINGVGYTYYLDAGIIPEIVRQARCKPGKALNFLKKVARECRRDEAAG